jgi:hypothetical protein
MGQSFIIKLLLNPIQGTITTRGGHWLKGWRCLCRCHSPGCSYVSSKEYQGWSCEWYVQVDGEIHQETWMILGNDTYDDETEPDANNCRSAGSKRNLIMHDEWLAPVVPIRKSTPSTFDTSTYSVCSGRMGSKIEKIGAEMERMD